MASFGPIPRSRFFAILDAASPRLQSQIRRGTVLNRSRLGGIPFVGGHGLTTATVKTILVASLFLGLAPTACDFRKEMALEGHTMGTTYHIKVVTGPFAGLGDLHRNIERRLEQINRSMSTYDTESEISRFNRIAESRQPFPVSEDFQRVLQVARRLHRLTGGAWDGTVMPLVNLWGFGPRRVERGMPEREEIADALAKVGFENLRLDPDGTLSKQRPDVTLDLASIAKGYGVDALAELTREAGFSDFLVEIGGEVYAGGRRLDGQPWRIGISVPEPGAPADRVRRTLPLEDRALATSGDYRNFFEMNGKRYTHIIDPRTGFPVATGVVSATVVAGDCTFADGLATALMVLDPLEGLALVNGLDGVEGLIMERIADGSLREHYSRGMQPPQG
jgi:thiamine biosynthesis lipoprotein